MRCTLAFAYLVGIIKVTEQACESCSSSQSDRVVAQRKEQTGLRPDLHLGKNLQRFWKNTERCSLQCNATRNQIVIEPDEIAWQLTVCDMRSAHFKRSFVDQHDTSATPFSITCH